MTCSSCGHERLSSPARFSVRRFLGMTPRAAKCSHMEPDEAGQTALCYCRDLAHGS